MSGGARLLLLAELAVIAFLVARAGTLRAPVPRQHGWHALAWTVLPALALLALWALAAPALVTHAVLATPAAAELPDAPFERAAILAQARAGVTRWHPLAAALAPAYARTQAVSDWLATAGLLLAAGGGFAWSGMRRRPGLPIGAANDRLLIRLLAAASLAAAAVAVATVVTLLWESGRFATQVSPFAFLFGAHWSPQNITGAHPGAVLGALPLFWGSLFIGVVLAMLVAVPLGLLSAIWLSHYAPARARRWAKPGLELLAGIPTVIYGYWALLTVAPAVRSLGLALGDSSASSESALAAGLVLGLMAVPYISSTSDDAFAAVPAELYDGSLALGATTAETVMRVLLPAALPGIVAGVLLAVSRTIGETMIAVMVASAAATITLDPFAPATTVTRQIVDLLTGEATFDSPKTLAAFALGLALFGATLLLHGLAMRAVRWTATAHA